METASDATTSPWLAPGLRARAIAVLILLPAAALLSVAAWLNPDPSGVGTHQQLGLRACTTLGATGFPCPTCGMTTAFAHAAHGQFFASLQTQPAGAFLALLSACATLIALHALITGLDLSKLISAFWSPRPLLGLGVIVIAGWLFKIGAVKGMW